MNIDERARLRSLSNKLRRLANTVVVRPMRGTEYPDRTELDAKDAMVALADRIDAEERRLRDEDLQEPGKQGTLWS